MTSTKPDNLALEADTGGTAPGGLAPHEWKAVTLAYGLLWGMSIDRRSTSDDLAYRARQALLSVMTKADQADGIQRARDLIAAQGPFQSTPNAGGE